MPEFKKLVICFPISFLLSCSRKEEFYIKFYSLLTDSTLKHFLKESPYLKFFSDLIEAETGYSLMDYTFHDQELNSGNKRKDFRLDILLKKQDHAIIIEANTSYEERTRRKNYSYLYRIAGSLYEKGENYDKKVKVTLINLIKDYCKEDKKQGLDAYKFRSEKYHNLIEDIESYEIYLEKYKGICYNGDNKVEAGFALLLAEDYEEAKRIVGDWKEGKEILDELGRLEQNDEFNALYNAEIVQKKLENSARIEGERVGLKKGESIGLKKGSKKRENEIASSMLKDDLSPSLISKYTGLSQQEILQLR